MTVSVSGVSNSLATLLGQSSSSGQTDAVSALTYGKTGKTTASTTTTATNGVSISAAAKAAAAEAADNAKDFATVGKETRATLDAAKKAGKTVDLTELSGRALAAMALNNHKTFSAGEQAAAKAELKKRTHDDFVSTVGGSANLTNLANYNQLMIKDYDSMSVEERGWTAQTRSQAAAFVATASNTSTTSLFDLLNQDS